MTSQGPPKIVQIHMRHPVDSNLKWIRQKFYGMYYYGMYTYGMNTYGMYTYGL